MRYVYSYFPFLWVFLSLEEASAQCLQSCMFWTAKLLQNIVLISMAVKPSPAVSPKPMDHFPPHHSGLSQPVVLLSPQTLSVLQINSWGSLWYLQSAPECHTITTKERSFIFLPTGAPSILKPNPSHLHIWSKSVPPQPGDGLLSPQGTSPSRVRSSRQEIVSKRKTDQKQQRFERTWNH